MIAVLRYATFVLLTCLVSTKEWQSLRIGAFNIQRFGQKKMNNRPVADCIVETVSRYDVILIQEIRNKGNTKKNVVYRLLEKLNSPNPENPVWNVTMSENLGFPKSTYAERYAYFYKMSAVMINKTHQWLDESFQRPPFIVRFKSASPFDIEDFGFIGIHTRPMNNSNNHTINEINRLADVYDNISVQWNLENFIIGGDFNAGRKLRGLNESALRNGRFLWAIGDDVQTAVKTNNSYDRLVLAGEKLQKRFVNHSAKVYTYKHNRTCLSLAKNISDHYPVELKLKNIGGKKRKKPGP